MASIPGDMMRVRGAVVGWATARCEAPKSRIRAQVSLHYRGSDELGLLRIVLAVAQTRRVRRDCACGGV